MDTADVPAGAVGLVEFAPQSASRSIALGASPTRAFLSVLLPLALPVISIAMLIRAIETFKVSTASTF